MKTMVLDRTPSGFADAWNDWDIAFFRITADLFSAAFCFGASVLLAANDEDAGLPGPVSR